MRVNVVLDDEDYELVKDLALKDGRSMSSLIRLIIKKYLEKESDDGGK